MPFSSVDFLVGFFMANAVAHLVLGLMKVRFFAGFGYGSRANIGYSILNIALAAAIAIIGHGPAALLENAIFWGALTPYVIYAFTGRYFYHRWRTVD